MDWLFAMKCKRSSFLYVVMKLNILYQLFFLIRRKFQVLNDISFDPFTKYEVFDHTVHVTPMHTFPEDCELVIEIKIFFFPFEILACSFICASTDPIPSVKFSEFHQISMFSEAENLL